MRKIISWLTVLAMLVTFVPCAAASGETISCTVGSAQMEFRALGENLIASGAFDNASDLANFYSAGVSTPLSDLTSYWRYNADGYLEAIGNGGSDSRKSLQTYIPLAGGEAIGAQKMYYFSMRVKADNNVKALGWNATQTNDTLQAVPTNTASATERGGRYPYYVSAEIDNNSMTYVTSDWMTIEDIVIASSDAKYFLLDARWLGASSTAPMCFDDITLIEVEPSDAESMLFLDDYIVTDTLPEIDGTWSDSAGFVADGVYTRPEIGALDTLTATYSNSTTKTFKVEVIGTHTTADDGGRYAVISDNLFKNASFEAYYTNNRSDGADYPFFSVWESTITGANNAGMNGAGNGCFYVKSDPIVTGHVSMRGRFDDGYNNYASFNQKCVLDEGTYMLSFYARKSDAGKRHAEIRLGGSVYYDFYEQMVLNTNWQRFSKIFTVESDNTQFEFDSYSIASVYFDDFTLLKLNKVSADIAVTLSDGTDVIYSETISNAAVGESYTYDFPTIFVADDKYYAYQSGEATISELAATDNAIDLTYRLVTIDSVAAVTVDTPQYIYPTLPERVSVNFTDSTSAADTVQWESVDASLYAVKEPFTAHGTLRCGMAVSATVNVCENYDHLEGWSSTADYSTHTFEAHSGIVETEFDILPLVSYIDGCVAYIASDKTLSGWGQGTVTIRFFTDGRFQYIDGGEFKISNVFYDKNTAYHVHMIINTDTSTYSAYVSRRGSEYGLTLCENAAFRSGSLAMNDVGQVCVRGGASAPAGEFIVGNHTIKSASDASLVRAYRTDDNAKNFDLSAHSDKNAKIILASYASDAAKVSNVYCADAQLKANEISTVSFDVDDDETYSLYVWDGSSLSPICDAKSVSAIPHRGYLSSFMGSFCYYNNTWDAGIHDEDHSVVQTLDILLYSDRIEFTMKNHGTVNPGAAEPATYVLPRENGDNSSIDTPLLKIACMSDIQIGYDLLTTAQDPMRPNLRSICNSMKDENYDVLLVGGDMSHINTISEERWNFVMSTYFDMLSTVTPNVIAIDGNHDHNCGLSSGYASGDYYNLYMKDNVGTLSSDNSFYRNGQLVAFTYEIGGVVFMGLNTEATEMVGSLQNTNYRYTDEAVQWVSDKLAAIGKDKNVFLVEHIPPRDSNHIVNQGKGLQRDISRKLSDILSDYPNLVMLYGHDHGGGELSYITNDTAERITRYDENGYKLPFPQ